jgi:small-conductance mechanosensitive channel
MSAIHRQEAIRAAAGGPLSAGLLLRTLLVCALLPLAAAQAASGNEAPLKIGGRTIHVFRAPVGMFTPEERMTAARDRIEQVLGQPGEGWTSVKPAEQGFEVAIDGKPMFLVVPGDARKSAGETSEGQANAASRVLQKVWSEASERRDPRANVEGMVKVALATALLIFASSLALAGSAALRKALYRRLVARLGAAPGAPGAGRLVQVLPSLLSPLIFLGTWVIGLFVIFLYLTYSLNQFVLTRPAGESLSHSIRNLAIDGLAAFADAVPGTFIAAFIFLLGWIATRISAGLFDSVRVGPEESPFVNVHTAPATRRIVNAALWLFALAMAYPYLPGSHTEAFKGLSVMVGVIFSIGAAGVVGQIASGMMIVYTYALRVGEYVRIAEYEGTVVEIGLFVTLLRTGLGEEVSLPNTFVLANVTRNYSRAGKDGDYVLDAAVTIGYDTPWRQVHALLAEAAKAVPEIRAEPAPYVVQTALSDFYVAYRLVAHVDARQPATRARVASDLHAAIQDAFNRHGVQIMSPHYHGDPAAPKIVPAGTFNLRGDR